MGQKVHPYGFRLGVNKPWRSRWFSERDYDKLLVEDVKLKAELREKLKAAGVSSVEIERLRYGMEARERERTRWAREIHDESIQGIGALRLRLANARDIDDSDTKDARQPKTGVIVETVNPGGPADKAGVKAGDAITEFDGEKVHVDAPDISGDLGSYELTASWAT